MDTTDTQVTLCFRDGDGYREVHWSLYDWMHAEPWETGSVLGDAKQSWLGLAQLAMGAAFRHMRARHS